MPRPNVLKSGGFMAFLATQFLGAFNDNVFKLLISLLAVSKLAAEGKDTFYVTLAAGLFTAPFLIFSPYAGFLADRFSKKRIMVWVKVAEIGIMAAGVLSFLADNLNLLLGVLFLMGAQSAFFGPAKYGFLPEVLPDEQLSRGNGYVQMWTFLAIILGGAAGGQLSDLFTGKVYLAAMFCVIVAIAGMLTSLFITPTARGHANRHFEANSLRIVWHTIREMQQNRALFLCMMGTAYFWFLGAIFQVNILFYGKSLLLASGAFVGIMQAAVALGMGIGSVLAGRWSGKKVEFGIVPIGAFGVTAFCLLLAFTFPHKNATLATVMFLGVSAGLFNIPMSTFIQQQSPDDSKGRFLATNSVISFAAMTVSYPVLWALRGPLQLHAGEVFFVLGLSTAAVIMLMVSAEPDVFVRSVIWICVRISHKMRVEGQSRIPKTGGALIVCNHLSLMDGLLVKIACQRPVRFLISRDYYDVWWLRPFLISMKAIPISDTDGPKALVRSLHEASACIEAGELVCIFPEGGITRTGTLQGFGRGIEHIMRRTTAPILPIALDGLWGKFLAPTEAGTFRKCLPWPRTRVTALVGNPIPSTTPTGAIREAVAFLSAEAYLYRAAASDCFPARFRKTRRGTQGGVRLRDAQGQDTTRKKLAGEATALAKVIHRATSGNETVGIALPPGIEAAKSFAAAALAGRVAIPIDVCGSRELPAEPPSFVITAGQALEKIPENSTVRLLALGDDGSWESLSAFHHASQREHRHKVRHRDPRDILCQLPDGTTFSHRQILAHVSFLSQALRLVPSERLLVLTRGASPFGICCGIWLPLLADTHVLWASPVSPPAEPDAVAEFAPRVAFCNAADLDALCTNWSGHVPASLKMIVTDRVLPHEEENRMTQKLGCPIMSGLEIPGLPAPLAVNVPDAAKGSSRQRGKKAGTAGKALPSTVIRIVSPTTNEAVLPGEEGHAETFGPLTPDIKVDDEISGDNWLTTSCHARMDQEGFITPTMRYSTALENV